MRELPCRIHFLLLLSVLLPTCAVLGGPATAVSFNGTNQYVAFADVTHGLAQGTVEFWFKPNAWNYTAASNGLYIWSASRGGPNTSAGDGMNFGADQAYSATGQLMFGIFNGSWQWAMSGVVPTPGTWYHVAGTWGPGGEVIYVNGVLKGTNPYTGAAPAYTMENLLGCSSWPESFFNGQVDELRVWKVARTQSQIQSNMNNSLTLPQANLVGYWQFNENQGTLAYNMAGFPADNGTLSSAGLWVQSTVPFPPDVMVLPTMPPPTNSEVTLYAAVNPNGSPTTVTFQWGTTPSLGFTTASIAAGSGSTLVMVSNTISTSNDCAIFHRATAKNALGTRTSGLVRDSASVVFPPNNVTNVIDAAPDAPGGLNQVFAQVNSKGAGAIHFGAGLAQINATQTLHPTNNITFIGEGGCDDPQVINGQTTYQFIVVPSGVTNEADYVTFTNFTTTTGSGGAIYVESGGSFVAKYCTFVGNSASVSGGAIGGPGDIQLNNCTFYDNSSVDGGAIDLGGDATLLLCTVASNTVSDYGGGIYVDSGGSVTLEACTIAGNVSIGQGGGVYNPSANTLSMIDTIIADNTAQNIASGPDVYGSITSSGFNLIGQVFASSSVVEPATTLEGADQIGSSSAPLNPLLGVLANYGGCTPTMSLLPRSPAIDTGTSLQDYVAFTTTDQRGFPRPTNVLNLPNPPYSSPYDASDIGAFEVQYPEPTLFITLAPNNMVVISWLVSSVNYQLQSSTSLIQPNWKNVTQAPEQNGSYYQVTLPSAGAPMYFQLVLAP